MQLMEALTVPDLLQLASKITFLLSHSSVISEHIDIFHTLTTSFSDMYILNNVCKSKIEKRYFRTRVRIMITLSK